MKKKAGVCAACGVDGVGPGHWHTRSHLAAVKAAERREEKQRGRIEIDRASGPVF